MNRCYCDTCGKEIPAEFSLGLQRLHVAESDPEAQSGMKKILRLDLCDSCMDRIRDAIIGLGKPLFS